MAELIENTFCIKYKSFKKELREARNKKRVAGYINFSYNGRQAALDYSVEYENDTPYLIINFTAKPQRILLSEQKLTFGTRAYLTCKCGDKTTALYLSKDIFACRKCLKLRYESTTINRTSKHGGFIYQQRNILKLINMRESIHRIFYRSQYSKRFKRWLELCASAGLTKEVLEAQKLMANINGQ